MSWVMPFPEKSITGEFGTMSAFRIKNKMQAHSGTDWAPSGSNRGNTLIPAIADGTIKLVQFSKVLGWVVVQTAADSKGTIWHIGYCHLACKKCGLNCKGGHPAEVALSVKAGDKVKAGDVSHGMTIGNSGSASSGAHLHATLGKGVKDVFGPTSAKSDLKKAIIANGGTAAPKVDKKTAKAIITGTPAPAPKQKAASPVVPAKSAEPTPAPTSNVGPLSQDDWKAFQEILKRDHGYTGAIDGIPGGLTYRSLQRSVAAHGYSGAIDGEPGENTYKALQRRLVAKGHYEGRVDGILGNATYSAWREAIRKNLY
jgi:murein DD-endopeptidase MepM/ murein hydrolase activator NlpD